MLKTIRDIFMRLFRKAPYAIQGSMAVNYNEKPENISVKEASPIASATPKGATVPKPRKKRSTSSKKKKKSE